MKSNSMTLSLSGRPTVKYLTQFDSQYFHEVRTDIMNNGIRTAIPHGAHTRTEEIPRDTWEREANRGRAAYIISTDHGEYLVAADGSINGGLNCYFQNPKIGHHSFLVPFSQIKKLLKLVSIGIDIPQSRKWLNKCALLKHLTLANQAKNNHSKISIQCLPLN